jgi:hypothetical protein
MHKSNIPDLPPVNSIKCEGLVKDVAREYSVQHSTFKKKVSFPMSSNSNVTASTQVSETLPDKKVDIATSVLLWWHIWSMSMQHLVCVLELL